jgi:ABC-type dipeptide/oligopeptide/nickel transport system permease component
MTPMIRVARRLGRIVVILFLVMLGSTALVRFAPGYLSDVREMDARYAAEARAQLSAEAAQSRSLTQMLSLEIRGWLKGDGGISREFGIPVTQLIAARVAVTGRLLLESILLAWSLAFCGALLTSAIRHSSLVWQTPATVLLAFPTAALATICVLANSGGPVLVMALILAARDIKFLHRILRKAWFDPYLLQARAAGLRSTRLLRAHILPALAPEFFALASLSFVTALSAIVPVEVIFNVPGLGQLAWHAAMNRDLPVLLAVILLMALAVTFSGASPDEAGRMDEWKAA